MKMRVLRPWSFLCFVCFHKRTQLFVHICAAKHCTHLVCKFSNFWELAPGEESKNLVHQLHKMFVWILSVIDLRLPISFLQGGVVSPTANLPEDQASVFISPGGTVAQLYPKAQGTNFSRLLRHTLALFLFPGCHTGVTNHYCSLIFKAFKRPIRVLATILKGRGFKPIRNDEFP
jgi:hypothetical protein